jgi:hypothetical protein
MLKQLLLVFIAFGYLGATAAPASPATLFALLFPETGEIRLQNRNSQSAVSLVFYSVKSASGALDGSGGAWQSIEDNYDVSGSGFIDPNGEWVQLTSSPFELAEGALDPDGGSLSPQRAVSLGRVWNPEAVAFPDLIFEARELNEQIISIQSEFALDGDYQRDGVIDQADYDIWKQYYGSTDVLLADGNLDGIVDSADYVVWRRNLGLSVPSLAIGSQSENALSASWIGGAVPEPASIALCAFGSSIAMFTRRRRRS